MRIRESIFSPIGITAIYFVIGSLWIAFSDIWNPLHNLRA